jgi:hypothetical protein
MAVIRDQSRSVMIRRKKQYLRGDRYASCRIESELSVISYQRGTEEDKRRFSAKRSGDSIAAGKQDAIWEQPAVSRRLLQVF